MLLNHTICCHISEPGDGDNVGSQRQALVRRNRKSNSHRMDFRSGRFVTALEQAEDSRSHPGQETGGRVAAAVPDAKHDRDAFHTNNPGRN